MTQKNFTKPRSASDLETVQRLISYDPTTGALRWRVARCWRAPAGTQITHKNWSGYVLTNISGVGCVRGHHIAWALHYVEWPVGQIDHINGVRDDNRIVNLRLLKESCLNQQNVRKKRRDSKQPFMGIQGVGNKFSAFIRSRGVYHYLGLFDSAEQAGEAYLSAKRRLHETCTI